MSLLHDVLRNSGPDSLHAKLDRVQTGANYKSLTVPTVDKDRYKDESDEEIIGVVSLPTSPRPTSRPSSRPSSQPPSRPPSPSRAGASARPAPGPLLLSMTRSSDPLKAFPTDVSQKIFGLLSTRDLAFCSRVSKKWSKSQTLNYVWFQNYRKDNFQDDSLPSGKWTRRESKQNWRQTYIQSAKRNELESPTKGFFYDVDSSTTSSGAQTPREIRESQWRQEAEGMTKPGKVEMREMYKELGGRKSKTKTKIGGGRDRAGWGNDEEWL